MGSLLPLVSICVHCAWIVSKDKNILHVLKMTNVMSADLLRHGARASAGITLTHGTKLGDPKIADWGKLVYWIKLFNHAFHFDHYLIRKYVWKLYFSNASSVIFPCHVISVTTAWSCNASNKIASEFSVPRSICWRQHRQVSDRGLLEAVLTLNVRGSTYLGLTRSVSWLLMPWLLSSPGHQQPWYWLCGIGRSLSYLRKDFNYLCHIIASDKLYKSSDACISFHSHPLVSLSLCLLWLLYTKKTFLCQVFWPWRWQTLCG